MQPSTKGLTALTAGGVAAISICVVSLGTTGVQGQSKESARHMPATSATFNTSPPAGAVGITAAAANALALRDKAEFDSSQIVSTVPTTIGALVSSGAVPGSSRPVRGTTADEPVWVVVFKGPYQPQFSRGESFQWGALIVDAATGRIVGSFAGNGPIPQLVAPQGVLPAATAS